ncbi:arginine--tRNA ligase [Flavobacteriaceae bacterium (ex Bugula neritina AB1)]|nr:arginine--tRNA ligase [Flavobacteriaceae bacterium (ex Bugula neritina AB1)]
MPIIEDLTYIFQNAFESCGYDSSYGNVVESNMPEIQFQVNGALPLAKKLKMNPRVIANKIIDSLDDKLIFRELSIGGPGFINVNITDKYLVDNVNKLLKDVRIGCKKYKVQQKVIIDFGGPNVAKPMHVGHLRSSIIGDSLVRLFRFMGANVVSDVHLGDWGTQMGMLITELKGRSPELSYFDVEFSGDYLETSPVSIDDLEAMYPLANARCKADPNEMREALKATSELQAGRKGYLELWKHFVSISIQTLKNDFDLLGVKFDEWNGESTYHELIPEMINDLSEKGFVSKSKGLNVINVSEENIPPLILTKSDGSYLYSTTDLATIKDRVDSLNAELVLYVVDKRQALHFKQVFLAAKKTGISKETQLEHIAFGTVNGKDGKPFKTRSGGVMKLQDLIRMANQKALERLEEMGLGEQYSEDECVEIAKRVGLAALKFADLKNPRMTDYIFDLDSFMKFEGRTGPYLLYSAVRIKSILKKSNKLGLKPGKLIMPKTKEERELLIELTKLPDATLSAYKSREPSILCSFIYNLSQKINSFYAKNHILREEDDSQQESWLSVLELCLKQYELVLGILGITIPEKM